MILNSSQWEKVDLPNLNNGHIKNAYFYNGEYIFEKWDSSYISTKDFDNWKKLDSQTINSNSFQLVVTDSLQEQKKEFKKKWSSYNASFFLKEGVLFYNDSDSELNYSSYKDLNQGIVTNSIDLYDKLINRNERIRNLKSLDSNLYFHRNGVIYSYYKGTFDAYIIRNLYRDENLEFAYSVNGKLNLIISNPSALLNVYYKSTYSIEDEKLTEKSEIKDSISSFAVNHKLGDYILIDTPPNPLIIKIDSTFQDIKQLKLLDNNYIDEFYVSGDTLAIMSANYMHESLFSIKNKKFLCLDCGYGTNEFDSIMIWDNYLKVDRNEEFENILCLYSKCKKIIKVFEFDEEQYFNGKIKLLECYDDFCLIILDNNLYKLVKEDFKLIKQFDKRAKYFFENDKLFCIPFNVSAMSNESDASYYYSIDLGNSWKFVNLSGKISNTIFDYGDSHFPNQHKIEILNDNLYSFTVDSLFQTVIGSEDFESVYNYHINNYIKYENSIYFLDLKFGKLYKINEANEIKYISLEPLTERKIHRFDVNNGYLYATDKYGLFRLKITSQKKSH